MTERLVFVSHRAPVVVDGGAPIRTLQLLQGLSRAFETTLVTFAHDPASPDGAWSRSELEQRFPGIDVVAVSADLATTGRAKRISQLKSLTWTRSWAFGRYQLPAFRRALHHTVRATGAAITHYNDFGVALSGPVPGTFNVYSSHNIEHRIQRGMAGAAGGARKGFAWLETARVRREERRVWREMDLCLAVSDFDAEAMRAGDARDVAVCLGGTDPKAAYELRALQGAEPLRMLFVGAGSYQPNEHGLAWFIENVLPQVREAVPAVLDVVGPLPDRPVRAPGVTYRGFVPSLDEWYRDAHVAVVPIFFGSGTRGKIPEAMAYGTPVISTTVGAEGLHVDPDEHYLRADTAAEFVRALIALSERLRVPESVIGMVQAARAAAERHFWPNIVEDLVATYRERVERPTGAAEMPRMIAR